MSLSILQVRQSTVFYTYLLTYSMVQNPSCEANWFAASQETPHISRNPKVHYRTHKRPPRVFILGQPNPVHIPTSHLLEIHPNIIHPSTPRSPQWSPNPYVPHAQPISFFSILSPVQYWVRSTNHLAPHYAISSIPPLPHPQHFTLGKKKYFLHHIFFVKITVFWVVVLYTEHTFHCRACDVITA